MSYAVGLTVTAADSDEHSELCVY